MIDPDLLDFLGIFLLGLGSTYLFGITGGVGLITLPALMFWGMTPLMAIATDLFALLGGRLGGMWSLSRAGELDWPLALKLSLASIVGALIGSFTLMAIDQALMRSLMGVFLLLMLAFLLIQPRLGLKSGQVKTWAFSACLAGFVFVGFWGTLVGAGFIAVGNALLLFLMRRSFIQSAAILTLVGFVVALVAVVVYGFNDAIHWPVGLALLAGKLIGGILGARLALKLGDVWIRRGFILIVALSAIKLLLD